MKYFYLFLLIVLTRSLSAQNVKTYLTSEGNFTNNHDKASSYIIFEKTKDSSYLVQQFDLNGFIMMQGFYKDSSLNYPNGKFNYYKKRKFETDSITQTALYENFIQVTGIYINGLQEDVWTEYLNNETIYSTSTFKGGKLNGIYNQYDVNNNNIIIKTGNYVNDKRDGEWKTYDRVNDLLLGEIYHDGILINTIHYKAAIKPPIDFYKTISSIFNYYKKNELKISFEVDTNGNLGNFVFDRKISDGQKKFITDAITNSGNFKPALLNAKPIKGVYLFVINNHSAEIDQINEDKKMDIISRHIDDIGRGLNQVGIGKPVE